ncbi:putative AAA+ ATPase domain, P-loop containing nucleoside triphosphate hydrolase [Helianthus annuus]|uniref:AAA+ ATPase domain, P-loop containing nucleoside triphosphate hydrolase n=2 Tax=Helianthus annuus TaxID=4232 RepID=A0A9K3JLJ6_HELAN|nr:putative AAA+ ATPase domain, P-loop containing nucleoside triphosphate hydrolase [Helianthus annuus]KAJ0938841.1 putative AAA+ ATPase domain, P-loop containing nucleoside triphosphate hydrolase [Helianthus annuus]
MKARLQELEAQLKLGLDGVRMVGIWGVGGSGKTTLASSLYMKISSNFKGHCIVDNIREESTKHGLKTLQEKVLSSLLNTQIKSESVEVGKRLIRSRLSRSKVLILLDDVDDIKQLDALAGSHYWFGSGSRIIITTRDEHLLRTHKVDHVSPVTLLSHEEAIVLFTKHAYNKNSPVSDYEKLSLRVVSYAAGLPLALKVIGSFLYDKNEKEWRSTLARLKDIPETEILKQLKISYDGLRPTEKELFLDIVCFYRRTNIEGIVDDTMDIFEACGYYPHVGIKVLRQKALITVVDNSHGVWFDMHDLVQEMGHYIVRGEHPNNPEKHSRLWKSEEIENMCFGDKTMENDEIKGIRYFSRSSYSSLFFKNLSNMKKLRWLYVYLSRNEVDNIEGPNILSNELRYISFTYYPRCPFPDGWRPIKLGVLELCWSLQKELWKGYKLLPHLKVLVLQCMDSLLSTPDFDGLPCLQKLKLELCDVLKEIHSSLGRHTSIEDISITGCEQLRMFPTIVQMGNLKTLEINTCPKLLEFPEIKSNMKSLVTLSLSCMGIDLLLSSIGERCANLVSLRLWRCFFLKSIDVNFYGLKHLEDFTLNGLDYMKMPDGLRISLRHWYGSRLSIWLQFVFPQLRKLDLRGCGLRDGEIPSGIGELYNLLELDLSGNDFTRLHISFSQLTRLELLRLNDCNQLVELPKLPSGIVILEADSCKSLATVGDLYTNCKRLCHVSIMKGVLIEGERLLDSMLQAKTIENQSMFLCVEGLGIAKEFMPPLVRGGTCRLKLPKNWCSDFCGFLMCAVVTAEFSDYHSSIVMSMDHMMSGGMYYADDVIWEEGDNDRITSVWYVSFASLRHTAWWNEIYQEVLFSIHLHDYVCSGVGVRLVARKSGSYGLTETSPTQEYEISKYAPNFKIGHDSQYALECGFLLWEGMPLLFSPLPKADCLQ